jgi:hypothetical protein
MQLGFMLIALIWKFDFSPFMILVIAILNDGGFEKTQTDSEQSKYSTPWHHWQAEACNLLLAFDEKMQARS